MATDAENFLVLLDLLDGRAGRYVFVSSVMAYAPSWLLSVAGDGAGTPTIHRRPTEGSRPSPKQAMLDRFAASGFAATVARPAAIYGPENNIYDMESAMFLRLRRGLPILLPHQGLVVNSFGHVDDLAAALLVMAAHPDAPGEIFNISGVGVTARAIRADAGRDRRGRAARHPHGSRRAWLRSWTGPRSAACSKRGTTA